MAPYMDDISSPAPATRAKPVPGPAAVGDGLDDLFDYDVDLDDVFRDLEPPKPAQTKDTLRSGNGDGGLGIDKEVEVTRKPRAPRVKLDENRLLSQAGIPKLKKRAKDVKFKGKGHEYSDAARLLSLYQLWLDDLFPKAKFVDALAMVEKLGHKKRMQIMRMDWINEGKPKEPVQEDSIFDDPVLPPREISNPNPVPTRIAPIFNQVDAERPVTPDINGDDDEDLYGATPRVSRAKENTAAVPTEGGESLFGPRKSAVDRELEDDLDALLAEKEMEESSAIKRFEVNKQDHDMTAPEPDFNDDMEAMAEMEGMW